MKQNYIDYLTTNYGRVDLTLEEMSKDLNLTPKTIANYAQRVRWVEISKDFNF